MKKEKQVFQGDIGLVRVAKLPEEAVKTYSGTGLILAYGEATGHHHVLSGPSVTRFDVEEDSKAVRSSVNVNISEASTAAELVSYVEIAEALAELTHEEHGTITLEPGIYRVTRQYEYVPGAVPKRVLD